MIKKIFFTALLVTMFTGAAVAVEYEEPILECDENFDKCAEKCGEDAPDSCFDKCEAESANCYKNYVYEDGSRPKVVAE